jgi:hypothetical protein
LCADGGSGGGGSLFGSYTAPQPGSAGGSLFGAPAASRQSNGGDEGADGGDAEAAGDGEGQELFAGGQQEVAPLVSLSEVPKQTGEENEDAVFTGVAAAWQQDAVRQQGRPCVSLRTLRCMPQVVPD